MLKDGNHFCNNELLLADPARNIKFSQNSGMITTCALAVFICFIMESIRWFRGIRPPYNVDLHTEQSSVANLKLGF